MYDLTNQLILGPRPKLKAIPMLGVDCVFTLLMPAEQPLGIEIAVSKVGLAWLWHPLTIRASELSPWEQWAEAVDSLELALTCGWRVYLHCAAGIHRTGCLTYLLLRERGANMREAAETVYRLRPVICTEIGDKFEVVESLRRLYVEAAQAKLDKP